MNMRISGRFINSRDAISRNWNSTHQLVLRVYILYRCGLNSYIYFLLFILFHFC